MQEQTACNSLKVSKNSNPGQSLRLEPRYNNTRHIYEIMIGN